ncbi:hypothetical protein LK536_24775 [Lachnoclostridium pacaense]|uniref:hypothetical protein n=1 Tax=Enterocloster hominis (ex Hitch et al. 2024) TaxID=1917870 RepID=UPI001D11BA84|nr:hypothetical protein [Lachnoclostridium pacaense]MCC2879476.1 hypothetical protein [Lachnoclostridium pacaense]
MDEEGYAEVTPEGDNAGDYYVEDVEIIHDDSDGWTNANPLEVEITLVVENEDETYFSGTSSSDFRLTLSDSAKMNYEKIKFVQAKRRDNNATLILTVQLLFDKKADTSRANAPTKAAWDGSIYGKALWNEALSSKYYQIQLLKDGSETGDIISIYNTEYDFSNLITEPGTYCFKVRSVKAGNNAKSKWITSAGLIVDGAGISGEGWQREDNGGRWWWRNPDGTYPVAQWKQINNEWYYFDEQGYMKTGWICLNGLYYYLDTESGEMYVNRWTPDQYWVGSDGAYIPDIQV